LRDGKELHHETHELARRKEKRRAIFFCGFETVWLIIFAVFRSAIDRTPNK
jgi:hypothetical protein